MFKSVLLLAGLATVAVAHDFTCGAEQSFSTGFFKCAGAGRHGKSAVCVPFRNSIPRPMVYEQCLEQCDQVFRNFPGVAKGSDANPNTAYNIDLVVRQGRTLSRWCRLKSASFRASYGIREMAYSTCMTVVQRVQACKSAHTAEMSLAQAAAAQAAAAQREKDLADAAEEAAKLRGSVPPPEETTLEEVVDTPPAPEEEEAPPAVEEPTPEPEPEAPVAEEPVEAPKPAKKIIDVTIPDGIEAGQSLRVTVADAPGGEITFQVPEGIAAGETVSVQYTPVEETPAAAVEELATQEAPEKIIQDEM